MADRTQGLVRVVGRRRTTKIPGREGWDKERIVDYTLVEDVGLGRKERLNRMEMK